MSLRSQLATLESSGLILLAQLQPEVEYLFRHALIQEAAYLSLVKHQRLRLHRVVGEALERLYPDESISTELAPVLARHFAEAGDQQRAWRYYRLAGDRAAERYANAEAIHHFGRALELGLVLPAEREAIAELYLRRGRAFELNSQDAEAIRNYQAMEAWAVAAGDRRAELAAINARTTIYVKPTVEQNLALGYNLAQKALGQARELADRQGEAKAAWNLLQYYLAESKMQQALEYGEQALRIAREDGLREQIAYALTDLSKIYFMVGRPERSVAAVDEARAIWRELGMLNMLADNLSSTAMMNILMGNYQQALGFAEQAQQVSRAIGNLWNQSYSYYLVDVIYFEHGEVGRAIEVAQECMRLAEQAGFSEGLNQTGFDLALIYAYMGALPRAFDVARRTQARADAVTGVDHSYPQIEAMIPFLLVLAGRLDEAQANLDQSPIASDPNWFNEQFIVTQFFFLMVQAELALTRGDYPRALALAPDVIARLQQAGVRAYVVDAMVLKGRALRATGQIEAAQATLEAARAEAEALGSRRTRWPILAELADIAASRGNQPAALALWRQAAEVVTYIAQHAGSAELSQSFVGQPAVQRVLQQAGVASIIGLAA